MKRRQKRPTQPTFDEYAAQHATEVAQAVEFLETQADLVPLERMTLKLAYVLNHNLIDLPKSRKGQAIRLMIVKITHEVFAFCGGLRAGTLDGGWHHLRALIEVRASLHYLFADKAKTNVRLEQFFEYGDLVIWQRRKKADEDLQANRITPLQYDGLNLVSDDMMARVTPQVLANWRTVWDKNDATLMKLKHWHRGTIKDLIDAASGDVKRNLHHEYEVLCQGTHVSPIGHRLANDAGPRTLGYEAKEAYSAVASMVGHMFRALRQIDLALDKKLLKHIATELEACRVLKRSK